MQLNANGARSANNETNEVINVREIAEKYLVYWKWIVASVVFFLLAGVIYYMASPRTYSFKAQVLVIDPNSEMSQMSVLKELSNMGFGSRMGKSSTNNEELVLKSGLLLERVVEEMNLHTMYEYQDKLRKVQLYKESPYRVDSDSALLYSILSKITFSVEFEDNLYKIHGAVYYKRFSKKEFYYESASLPLVIPLEGGRLIISKTEDKSLADEKIYVTIYNPDAVVTGMIRSNIQTEINKLTDDIVISCKSGHQILGKDILSQLIYFYNKDAVEQLNQSASFTSVFIDERMKILNEELDSVERSIERYKQQNELTDIQKDAEIFLETNAENYNKLIEAEIQLELLNDLSAFAATEKNRYNMIPDIGLADKGLIQIINQYNQLLLHRNEVYTTTGDANPTLQKLNTQLTGARESILAAMANSRKALRMTRDELSSQYNQLKNRLKSLPQKEREYIDIQRQQQVKAALYVFLLQKREEASLNMAIATNKARVLNKPVLQGIVTPKRVVVGLASLLLGLLFPVVVLLISDLINTKIMNREDVEKLTSLPILTELCRTKSHETLFDHNSIEETNAELFRLLRAKLQFVMDHPSEKVILVTSTQPGEGKSFVSLNLAVTLSLMDKKVLLVGLDLRKPTIAKYMGIHSREGITSYLSGQSPDVSALISPVKQYPGLSVLPAGIIPPNPNELLVKDRFSSLFEELKREFDYIVLDTAPVGAVSDTHLVDKVADICIYVCRSEYSDKRNIAYINRLNEEGTLKRIHLVINDVDFDSKKNAFYRKYGYGYGYGYSHKND